MAQAIVPQSEVRESGYYIYIGLILLFRRNMQYIDKRLLLKNKRPILEVDRHPRRAFGATYHEHIRDNNICCYHLRVRSIAYWKSAESESIEG